MISAPICQDFKKREKMISASYCAESGPRLREKERGEIKIKIMIMIAWPRLREKER